MFLLPLFLVHFSCKPQEGEPEPVGGKIVINFGHEINAAPLITDTMIYVNAAQNHYKVSELMYFVSEVALRNSATGEKFFINDEKKIHYVDIAIPATLQWKVFDEIPAGSYDSVSFIFGLNETDNVSFAFVNPPEVNMFWPEILGGGYHYLMLNGKWLNNSGKEEPFDFHLGIGQLYSGVTQSTDSITGFVHNYFTVSLPLADFTITKGETRSIDLVMNVDSWFCTPHVWDFNEWGGYIMQNQEAMATAAANGRDVFSIEE